VPRYTRAEHGSALLRLIWRYDPLGATG